jgi:hypothetical protein
LRADGLFGFDDGAVVNRVAAVNTKQHTLPVSPAACEQGFNNNCVAVTVSCCVAQDTPGYGDDLDIMNHINMIRLLTYFCVAAAAALLSCMLCLAGHSRLW